MPTMLRQTALIHLFAFLAWQTHILGQPLNDLFENRITLTGAHVSTAISFGGATLDAVPETYPFAASDMWYSWTAAANGSLKVEANDELGYPYEIRVYTGNDASNLARLNPLQLENVYAVDAGVSYTVRLVKYLTASTHDVGGLDLQFIPAVTNDLFANRIQLVGDSIQWEAWSPDATYNAGEPSLLELGRNCPVSWWKWTAPANGQAFVSGNNDRLAIFEGDDLTNLIRLPSGFEAVAGREYQIAVFWVFSGNPIGLTLSLNRFLPYTGLEPNASYTHIPTRTLEWLEFPDASLITNFTASIDGATFGAGFIQTNRLVNVPLPILSEGVHRLDAFARSLSGLNYMLKPFEFSITHPNSSFINRITLAGDTATFEADFRGVQGYLWWSWTAPFSGQVTFEDLDQIGFRLDIFSGLSQDQLTWIESKRVEQGATYTIRGMGMGSAADGRVQLRLFPVPALNDSFANSKQISGSQFADWICISCATTEPGEPVSMRGSYGKTLWYSFVPPTNGLVTLSRGSGVWNWDSTLFTGASLSSLLEIKRPSWDFSQYPVQAGERYHIRIQSYAESPDASEVRFNFNSPPVNDDFMAATTLSGDQARFTVEMNAATPEPGEPDYSTNRHSVWWRWTPQSSGFASLSIPAFRGTNDSTFSFVDLIPIREIFRGEVLTELAPVTTVPLHDEVIGFSVLTGVTYSIRLSYLKPFFAPEPFEVHLNVGNLEFISPASEAVFVLPEVPQFRWTSPILGNSTTQIELVEQTAFYLFDSGWLVSTALRGTAVWPDFAVTSAGFSPGLKRVFARVQLADGAAIYSPPLEFSVAQTLPLRLELFRSLNQPQYLSLRELSNQRVIVESSSDLRTWIPETFIQVDSTSLIDPQQVNSRRFFRSSLR